ncbi:cell division protein CrgA [Nocardioides zeae]|uniref:Cell division protein CrgA n=2 Tax=Nocardioides zeae TaxID=1457234 RepID=A0A6P0HK44_9ACTN|nr:cell division protein CrgA [Nocardioides zeae]
MVLLVVAGIAWIALTWRSLGLDTFDEWSLIPDGEQPRRWVWELGLWNYAIGFGAILLGLIVGAHPSTPLGRGNGVVVGMLACFGIGLLWICTFYLFADDISSIWVFGALGQWNLVVGIAFMAVGFSYATKWE